jgi:hypothetical protein
MFRKHAYSLAVVIAAVLLTGGTLAIVRAQQPSADKAPVAGATSNKALAPAPAGAANTPPGANFGPAGFGGAPGSQPRAWTTGELPGRMPGMAADDDPEMTELSHTEAALANDSAEIFARFAETENAADRKKISAELRESLAKQFDVQRQRRELELGRIEEQVRKLREQLKKRTDARETIIERRLDQLINEAEGLGWAPPAQAIRGSAVRAMSDMMRSMTPGTRSKAAPAKR